MEVQFGEGLLSSEGNEEQGKAEGERQPSFPYLLNTYYVLGAILGSEDCSSEEIHKDICPSWGRDNE